MLLKIGEKFIDTERAAYWLDGTDWEQKPILNVYVGDNYSLGFKDTERLALLSYLDSMAVDVMAVYAEKNKPDCETCNDMGAIAIRGDNDTPCKDCVDKDCEEIPY